MRLALEDLVVTPERSLLDYGCGRGGDVERLSSQGIQCSGWDPVYRADAPREVSDVVNLGYVVNVIEDPRERADTLRAAWDLARSVLVVSARLKNELKESLTRKTGDGYLTQIGTFQKFYEQSDLKDWIEESLGTQATPAAPGVFYVFRSEQDRQTFLASRFRIRRSVPALRKSDVLYKENEELFQPLIEFLERRGRLPAEHELPTAPQLIERMGSLKRAYQVIRRISSTEEWDEIAQARSTELLIYLALQRFEGWPRFSELPSELQLDIKAYYGSYKKACERAQKILFAAGDAELVDQACKESPVGKLTYPALYVHVSAMGALPPILRVFEGCARNYLGSVDGATVVKLSRREPKVSYLSYPDFDHDPHPALEWSIRANLRTFGVKRRNYGDSSNPPILHRKEEFVESSNPLREKFARLTLQEERANLYTDTKLIGTRKGWEDVLTANEVEIRGHRVIKKKK